MGCGVVRGYGRLGYDVFVSEGRVTITDEGDEDGKVLGGISNGRFRSEALGCLAVFTMEIDE